MKRKTLVGAAAAAAFLLFVAGAVVLRSSSGKSQWKELDSVTELAERFNRGRGSTRIVLLLSPT